VSVIAGTQAEIARLCDMISHHISTTNILSVTVIGNIEYEMKIKSSIPTQAGDVSDPAMAILCQVILPDQLDASKKKR